MRPANEVSFQTDGGEMRLRQPTLEMSMVHRLRGMTYNAATVRDYFFDGDAKPSVAVEKVAAGDSIDKKPSEKDEFDTRVFEAKSFTLHP